MSNNNYKLFGDSREGIFGFPMKSALAKIAEAALKAIPADVKDRYKTVIGTETVEGYMRRAITPKGMDFVDSASEQSDVSIITSEAIDHDEESIIASGLDFDSVFTKNSVVPWCHDYEQPPVGRSLWVAKAKTDTGGAWKAKTRYTPRPDAHPADAEWFPSTVFHYVKCGDIRGKSIGFIPTSIRKPSPEEIKSQPALSDIGYVIDRAMVLEYSVCPLGCNPEALVESVGKMRSKGLLVPAAYLKTLGVSIPEGTASVAEVEAKDVSDAPNCAKCGTAEHMKMGEGNVEGECYKCEKCGTSYRMMDDGIMTEILPERKNIRPFVRPETIQKAIDQRKSDLQKAASVLVSETVTDTIAKIMGRV